MISLKLQVLTIIVSFLYGIFFSFFLDISSKYIYNSKLKIKILFSFLFILINTILYFAIMNKINNGIIHYYSFIAIIIGFFVENHGKRLIVKKYIK